MRRLDEKGHEALDPNPVEIPAGLRKPESLEERIRRIIRSSVSDEAAQQGLETFEEANDFEIDDDPVDPETPYETDFDPVLGREVSPADVARDEAGFRKAYMESASSMQADDGPEGPSPAQELDALRNEIAELREQLGKAPNTE